MVNFIPKHRKRTNLTYTSCFILITCYSFPAQADEAMFITDPPAAITINEANQDNKVSPLSNLSEIFKPRPATSTRLDYTIWSNWLKANVLYMGPSQRKLAPSALEAGSRSTSSRFIIGHKSRYRFEGNKIPYRTMRKAHKDFLPAYQKDLEVIANRLDIASLPRNEQLAFWFNLHNVTLINMVANNYPIRHPRKIKPITGNLTQLHDAKVLTIKGRKLSLRDIREKIVYANWTDSAVIYGFHDGTLGGPNINYVAYNGQNLSESLNSNAKDFTNSFRGYRDGKVSPIYKDAAPFFFPEIENDIRNHLKRFMRDEVFADLSSYEQFKWHKPIPDVADLAGGYVFNTGRNVSTASVDGGISFNLPYVSDFVQARENNIRKAQKRGWLPKARVIIEDIQAQNANIIEVK